MGGESDDRVCAQESTAEINGGVILTNVDTISAYFESEIRPIVHDEWDAEVIADTPSTSGCFENMFGVALFLAKLNNVDTTSDA